jgi:hypothetical protein
MNTMWLGAPHTRRALVLAMAVATILLVPLTAVHAATPASGTISQSSPTVSWSGANKVPTASNNCGGPNNAACDNFQLTIQSPSYSHRVVIKLQPFAAGDWDVQVWAPNGGLAASSGNAPGHLEIITLTNPPAGTYTVAASPFAPVPGAPPYTASAEIVPYTAPPGGTAGSEPITYASHATPAGMGDDAGEPSLGANLASGNVMFQAGLQTLKATFNDSTSPGVATWTDVSFPSTSVASLDPIGFIDQRTNRWFTSQLSGTTSLAALTDNDGGTWIPSEGGPLNGGVDHQTFGGGPYHAPLSGTPLYPNAVYYCSQDILAALCARSDNGGVSFAPAVPTWTDECEGLHGHVKVAPNGTVYVPNKNCRGKQGVAVSTDNGLTWAIRTVSDSTAGAWDPSVATGADGTLYFAYDDGDGHAKVAVSHDEGRTWSDPRDVGAGLQIANSAFPAVVAGDKDRAAFAFLGTTETSAGAMGDDTKWPGVWYLFVAHTYDGGNTWTTVNATPNDPVQRGTICGGGFGGCDNGTRNMLDFMDATVDRDGRALVAIADGCTGACVTSGPGSFTAKATIVREVSGKRLFASKDVLGPPAAPAAFAKASSGPPPANVVSWTEPDDHGSAITSYKVYRRPSTSSSAVVIATVSATTTTYTDSAIVSGQSYFYKVSAVNGQGEGPASPEVQPVAAQPPPPVQDPCTEPGATILTDPAGDATDQQKARDVLSLSIAEPREIGAGNIEFILKMASLESVPSNTTWPVQYKTPDGTDRWVKMATALTGGAPTFAYGTGTSVTGAGTPAAAGSGFTADGTIRIVVPRAAIGANPGTNLTDFLVRIRNELAAAGALTPDNMPDSLARTGAYTVKGNENCTVPQPDLTLSGGDITFSGLKGQGNDQVVVAIVHNRGTALAQNVQVRITVDGSQVGNVVTIPQIVVGGTGRASVVWDTHGQNGSHTIAAVADPSNSVAESNESNNVGSKVALVQGSKVTSP